MGDVQPADLLVRAAVQQAAALVPAKHVGGAPCRGLTIKGAHAAHGGDESASAAEQRTHWRAGKKEKGRTCKQPDVVRM